jgi:hypothetical protein
MCNVALRIPNTLVLSFTPRRLYPRAGATGTHSVGGWVGPRPGLGGVKKRKSLAPAGN